MINFDLLSSSSESDEEMEEMQPRHRRRRTFKPRINFNLPPPDNRERCRLTDGHIDRVVDVLAPLIEHETN